ncbi:beta-glucosidase [Planoprotostelium fungivorum]|uniref:Beta-glucosidase n=1 Tax=Planoprotostelium fungivorum TaxID=1890364 RepID=A0A2P6N3V1_9EUKA|nr:beta-glucosidase [Planoprotostelium fungivorum]
MRPTVVCVVLFTISVATALPSWCGGRTNLTECATYVVSQLTLEEKIKQFSQLGNDAPAVERLNIEKWDWWGEALHGLQRQGYTTSFPQSIGLGATFDPELLHEIGDQISTEDRLKRFEWAFLNGYPLKGLSVWTPNINIFRDPRWGRGQETYGEDPFLTGTLAIQFVRGIQGPEAPERLKAIATPKHFAVHSGPELGRHSFNVNPSKYDFEDTFMPAFRAAIHEGRAASVMCSYNAIDGVPACANEGLLGKKLRQEWNFWGYVVSDCDAVVDEVGPNNHHNYTQTKPEAAALSIIAGTDLDCGNTYDSLNDALTQGLVTIDVMDRALERLFHVRLTTHEDDHPASTPFPDNRDLALRASLESMVLLQNDGILPLQKGMKVAIVGPTVDILEDLEGNYHGTPRDPVSTLDAAYDFFGAENVTYAQGSLIDDGVPLIVPRSALRTPDGKVGLRGEYFTNTQLMGQPALVRNDHTIDFDTDFTPLFDAPNPWDYSVRWTGSLVVPGPGTYDLGFNNDGDNSVLLYVEGRLLLNTTGQKVYEKITFQRSGAHDILIEFHHKGGMRFRMEWMAPVNVQLKEMVQATAAADVVVVFVGLSPSLESEETGFNVTGFVSGDRSTIRLPKGGMRFRMEWMAPVNVQLKQMVQATAAADVVVVFVGLSPSLESEETGFNVTGFVSGDRSTIRLPKVQRVLLKALEKLRKPVVLVLNSGSAVAIDWATQHARAALAAWYSGELGGKAIIDTLVGRYNPAGRLPITFYRSDKDLPPFKSYEMEGRTYRYFRGTPLYPFGHGLSYTTFSYSGLVVPSSVRAGDDVNVTVTVIQVYLRHFDGATPKKVNHALVAFQRVTLKAGESGTFTMVVRSRQLSVVDEMGERAVKEGQYQFFVGGGQPGFVDTLNVPFDITGTVGLPG